MFLLVLQTLLNTEAALQKDNEMGLTSCGEGADSSADLQGGEAHLLQL